MSEPVASSEDRCYRFGGFDFDARALALRKGGRILRARPQSLKLLTLLISRAGELVSRDDIQHELWGRDTFVDFEQGVNHCIKELRGSAGRRGRGAALYPDDPTSGVQIHRARRENRCRNDGHFDWTSVGTIVRPGA